MGRKQLLVGTAILAGANILTKCMGFFYRIFMSNYIGAEGMGLYQLILPLYTLAWSITAGGFTTTVSRLTAREHARGENGSIGRIVKQSAALCLLLSIILSGFLFLDADWVALHILHEPRTALSLRLLAFAIPFMSVGSCLRGFFQGLQQMTVPAFSQILEQLLRIGAIYLLAGIFVPQGLEYACFAAVCGIVLGEAGAFCYTFFHYLHKKRRWKFIRKPSISSGACFSLILSMAIPLGAIRITGSLLSTLENILIPQRLALFGSSSQEALASYGELTGMVMPLLMLPSAFLMAFSVSLVPEISEACAVSQNNRIRQTVSTSLLLTSILGAGSACLFAVFPREICYVVYGRSNLGGLLFPLAFLCPLLYGQTTINGLLNGLGEHFFLFWSHILSSLITIAFIWFAMPYWGLSAFCTGWFCSLLAVTILSLRKLKKRTGVSPSLFDCFGRPILAGIAAALIIRLIIQTSTPSPLLFCGTLLGMGILYLVFLGALGCLDEDTLQLLKRKRT